MNTLIIGASGFLGSALYSHLKDGDNVIGTYNQNRIFDKLINFSIPEDSYKLKSVFIEHNIQNIVFCSKLFNCSYQEHAFERFLASLTEAIGDRRIIYISSDAVFDGKKGGYVETDKPNSNLPYGEYHINFENAVNKCVNHLIVRLSFIYGFNGLSRDNRFIKLETKANRKETIYCDINTYKSPVEVNYVVNKLVSLLYSSVTGIRHIVGKRKNICAFYRDILKENQKENLISYLQEDSKSSFSDTSLLSIYEHE